MKKILSLLLIISLCFAGSLYAQTSAAQGTADYQNTTGKLSISCTVNDPADVKNDTQFTMVCPWATNDNSNIIQFKSSQSGKLINSIHANLTPRLYSASYVTTVGLDTLDVATSVGPSTVTATFATIFNINADTSVVADFSMNGTVTATFTINDGALGTGSNNTLTNIYLGTYADTLHMKIVRQ